MAQKSFYVDACIYINLWQEEGDKRYGIPYWKIAKDFFEKHDNENNIIYYSGFLLKEMKFILEEKVFAQKRELFDASPNFKKIDITKDELNEARKIESETNFEISFYDIIHLVLARKTMSVLITRDSKLLEVAKKYSVNAGKPEEFL
jgi:predicted nucleic acid-binding protein